MARERTSKIKLVHPDKSGPDPSQQTLLDIAAQRGILAAAQTAQAAKDGQRLASDEDEEPLIGRLGEAVIWSISLTTLHLTFDILTQNQYAATIQWDGVVNRSLRAFVVILALFYTLHPHASPSPLLPRLHLSTRSTHILHQLVFLAGSIAAGCHLIYITNEFGYYAVLKQAPPLGVLWIWSVVELDLLWALGSMAATFGYLWWQGYSYI